ncbi:MAG TPA: hypothetical protein VG944_04090, partial [Fimbriimonas sp.]|nr:hypothetical protein [Fimbriimonas sp.]
MCVLARPVTVSVDTKVTLNRFVPSVALGAGIDGHEQGEVAQMLSPLNVRAMRSAGLKPLTYRLRTELDGDAWHWNPEGSWSDPGRREGYWTSSDSPHRPILLSYGYKLPRRGNTVDQGNNDGYSRIDDGSLASYWKSNPYLDRHYTGDPDDLNRQWVVIDLKRKRPCDTLRIHWANPYAVRFTVEYWTGEAAKSLDDVPFGEWKRFPNGHVTNGTGGRGTLHLGSKGQSCRFVRIWLEQSSHTREPSQHVDPRDSMGFAIRELELGETKAGHFVDWVHHEHSNRQTPIYVSSTDPWHRAVDKDLRVEQPGFDWFFRKKLTSGLPVMMAVPVLYDTPENAAAEIRWLWRRHDRVWGIEMGEEPDGQYCSAEHYASLYLQVARLIRKTSASVRLGGPCFQTTVTDVSVWPDRHKSTSWMRRFLDYLRLKGKSRELQFFSFEWYPFDDMREAATAQLERNPALLRRVLERLQHDGLPKKVPWVIGEYGYSAFAGPQEVELPGALLNLDIVGTFLSLGGSRAYLYGYEPNEVITEKGLWGNLMMLEENSDGGSPIRLPTYWAARMMTQSWCQPRPLPHRLVKTWVDGKGLSAYTVVRPDGSLATLVLNKRTAAAGIGLQVDGRNVRGGRRLLYDSSRYRWGPAGSEGEPALTLPPKATQFKGEVTCPPMSITLLLP